MERAIEIAEIKYLKEEGWRHVWVFDHSSYHAAMADDALDVNKMRGETTDYAGHHMELEGVEVVLHREGWQRG